jgi:hypothetical protein
MASVADFIEEFNRKYEAVHKSYEGEDLFAQALLRFHHKRADGHLLLILNT